MTNLKSIKELQNLIHDAIATNGNDFTTAQPVELYEPIQYILAIGGKHLRPALVLMAADMYHFDLL